MTAADVKMVVDAVNDLDVDAIAAMPIDTQLAAWDMLEEARSTLAEVATQVAHNAAAAIPDTRARDDDGKPLGALRYVANGTTYERHGEGERTQKCIDEEGLYRVVLDTRVVDKATGEVRPPHEVLTLAYGSKSRETGVVRLTGATPSKVKALGIDPELFFDRPPFSHFTLRRLS